MKRFISLIVVFLLLVSGCTYKTKPNQAKPQNTSDIVETSDADQSPLNITWNPHIIDNRAKNKDAIIALIDAIMNYAPSVTYNNSDAMYSSYVGITMSFPPVFLTYLEPDKDTNTINISYLYSKEEHSKKIKDFGNKIESIVAQCCKNGDDEIAKALYLYRYISQNVNYAYNFNLIENGDQMINSYSALINGSAICVGFSDAYNYLLWQVGIDAWQVQGISGKEGDPDIFQHAWSLIRINDKYYFCDPTFEQELTYGEGLCRFGWTTEQAKEIFKGKLGMGAYTWVTEDIPNCVDTSFQFAQKGKDFIYDSKTGELTVNVDGSSETKKVK